MTKGEENGTGGIAGSPEVAAVDPPVMGVVPGITNTSEKPVIGWFTKTMVHRPCLVLAVSMAAALLLVALAATSAALALGASWMDFNDEVTKQVLGFNLAAASVGKSEETITYGTRLCMADQQSISMRQEVRFYLRSKSKDVLSEENMKAQEYIVSEWNKLKVWSSFCRLRNLTESDTACEDPLSFFRAVEIDNIGTMGGGTNLPVVQAVCNKCHASYNDSFKCPSLALAKDMKAPASVEKSLPTRKDMEPYMKSMCKVSKSKENSACENGMRQIRSTLVDIGWDCDSLKAEYAQVVFRTGWPFADSKKDNPDLCKLSSESNETFPDKMMGAFTESYSSKALAHMLAIIKHVETDYPDLTMAFEAPSNFRYVWTVLLNDVAFVGISVVLVAVVLTVQTGSFFVMLIGIFEILVSFPIAAFVWFVVFQQKGITNLMFIGVFVILGIGADDIFVYVDAWKQSAFEDKSISGSLETRFAWAYRRAVVAMTSTSVTTFFCFCICIVSPVWDFRCFGITCGFMILADFALVMTLLPAAVLISETKINPCWEKCCKSIKGKMGKSAEGDAMKQPAGPRKLELFFGGPFADFVIKERKKIIAVYAVLSIVSIALPVAFLRMSNEEYTFAPPDHLLSRSGLYAKKFRQVNSFTPSKLTLVAGLQRKNAWSLADAYPVGLEGGENSGPWGNGKLNFDTDFDIGSSQQQFNDACSAFHKAMKETDDAKSYDTFYNVMEDFAEWAKWKGHGFPVPASNFGNLISIFKTAPDGFLNASMMRYKATGESPGTYRQLTGFMMDEDDKTKVKVIWCGFNLTSVDSGWGDPYGVVDAAQKRMDKALVVAEEKSGLKNIFHTTRKWIFNRMIANTFEFAVTSLVISYCIACLVILAVTGNWRVTLISSFVLLSIISFSLMGLVICGFSMSLNECCVILVAAGMSVDYLLHMSHSFNHQHGNKQERVRKALREMGISVFSGAVTTLSAAISLCFCVFYIYSRLGIYLIWLIVCAFVYSVTVLTALLAEYGPNDGEGLLPWAKALFAKQKKVSPRPKDVEMAEVAKE